MQSPVLRAAICAAIFLMALPDARGILCYQCNSKRDAGCEVLAPAPANGTARYLLPCDDGPSGEPAFCRSSVIKVLAANKGEGETRWVRACGWVQHKSECYQFDDDDHHEVVCQCFEDACNAAATRSLALRPALLGLAAALAAPYLALRR